MPDAGKYYVEFVFDCENNQVLEFIMRGPEDRKNDALLILQNLIAEGMKEGPPAARYQVTPMPKPSSP